jgi:hypothetical protein
LLPSRGFFVPEVATLAICFKNWRFSWESAPHERGIYRRNGWSAWNCQLLDEESFWRLFIPPGIPSSETRNLPEEWDSVGNYQLIDEECIREIGFRWKLLAHGRWFRPVRWKFKYENVIKLEINLIRSFCGLHI